MNRHDDYSPRFKIPNGQRDFESRYDFTSQEVQDLAQRKPKPFIKHTFTVTNAQTDPLIIAGPGRGFVQFGFITNALVDAWKQIDPTVYLSIRVNEDLPECEWAAKHNRGFRGDFDRLFVRWPAQVDGGGQIKKSELYIFKFDAQPFESGEAAV